MSVSEKMCVSHFEKVCVGRNGKRVSEEAKSSCSGASCVDGEKKSRIVIKGCVSVVCQ